jgi:hypothetical protein
MIFHIHALQPARKVLYLPASVNEIRELFFKYSPWLVLAPASILACKAVKPGQRILLPLLLYFFISVAVQALSLFMWHRSINNLPLLHLYTPVEFLLLLAFFSRLPGRILSNKLFWALGMSFLVLAVADSLFLESIYKFNVFARSLEALILIVLAVKWFVYAITTEENGRYNTVSINYLVSGVFIYFAGGVVLFSFSNQVNRLGYSMALNVWSVHTLLLFLFYLLTTIALLRWKTT